MRSDAYLMAMTAIGLSACAAPGGPPPSLQPRAAEAIDPRLPVPGAVNDRPVSPALAQRLAALIAQARQGDSEFGPLAAQAERLAAVAGAPQRESWIVAQQAVSAAIGGRGATTRALGDIDALGANALEVQAGMAPADLAAMQDAARQVGEIDRRQAAIIAALQRQLGI